MIARALSKGSICQGKGTGCHKTTGVFRALERSWSVPGAERALVLATPLCYQSSYALACPVLYHYFLLVDQV